MTDRPDYRRYTSSSPAGQSGRRRQPFDRRSRRQAALRRRRFIALMAGLAVLVVVVVVATVATGGDGSSGAAGTATRSPSPSPSGPPQPTSSPTALAAPSAEKPLRLFVGGDSMGGELAAGVVPVLYDTGVVKPTAFYKVSSGLSRPDFYDWVEYWRKYAYRYKAIVFMLGTNDGQNMVEGGEILPFPSDAWRAEYQRRAGRVMDIMLGAGVQRVYWVGMPIMGSKRFSSVMRAINAGFRDAAWGRDQVKYVDIWKVFAKADGTYDPRWRQDDGIHFNFDGVHRLAEHVAGIVEKDWRIGPAPDASAAAAPSASAAGYAGQST